MVKPSNPKLMARVLEAVTCLSDGKGSLTRDILKFVKQNSASSSRNLTMQVHRALKHAVTAGLLGCKSGRYKMQLELSNVSQRRQLEDSDDYKSTEVPNDMRDELQIDGINLAHKVQGRQRSSRKKNASQRVRKRSRTRTAKKATRRRAAKIERRSRKMSKRSRHRTINDKDRAEDWSTRKRRMMSKPKFVLDDDDDEEEDEEEEEEEEEEATIRGNRRLPKMKSVNEDRYSNASGDSSAVGRHRSRRSKHLAKERRSPPRKGNGDTESQRKSSKRSTSRRRRSQPRQREPREIPAPEEPVEDHGRTMEEERETEAMEMDEDQGDIERSRTPPENHENE